MHFISTRLLVPLSSIETLSNVIAPFTAHQHVPVFLFLILGKRSSRLHSSACSRFPTKHEAEEGFSLSLSLEGFSSGSFHLFFLGKTVFSYSSTKKIHWKHVTGLRRWSYGDCVTRKTRTLLFLPTYFTATIFSRTVFSLER